MRLRWLVFAGFILFFWSTAKADQLPISFANNGIKLLVSRSSSDSRSVIKLEVRVPGHQELIFRHASNPTRIILDIRGSRITRNRSFSLSDSPSLKSIRFGVHPDFFRVVMELKGSAILPYSHSVVGDWITVKLNEGKGEGTAAASDLASDGDSNGDWGGKKNEAKFGTKIWNKVSTDTKNDSKTEVNNTNTLDVRPEFEFTVDDSLRFLTTARFRSLSEFGNSQEQSVEAKIYDTYVAYTADDYSVKVGNQVVTWGKADEISPLDNLNPEDLRDGPVRRRLERKIPIPMVNAEVFARGDALQFIFIPVHVRSRIDFIGSDWASLGNSFDSVALDEDRPKSGAESAEYGARFKSDAGSFDYAVSFLSTRNDLPSLKSAQLPPGISSVPADVSFPGLAGAVGASGQLLGVEYNRREVIGLEFETVLDSIGIRGDFAYTRSEDFLTTALQRSRNPTFRYVMGVDYSSASDLYVNVQYYQTVIANWQEQLLFNEQVQHRIFTEISQEFSNNEWKVGLRILQGFSLNQYLYNPFIVLQRWDDFNFEFGSNVLGGQANSQVGYFANNDELYLIFRAFL